MIKKDTDTRCSARYKYGPSRHLDLNPYLTCIIEDFSIIAISGRTAFKASDSMRLYCLKTLKPMKAISYTPLSLYGIRYVSELKSLLAYGHNTITLFNTAHGFRETWKQKNNLEIEGVDFVFEESKVLAVGKFHGVAVWSLEDPDFHDVKLQHYKRFGHSITYIKSCKKVLIMTRQNVAVTDWPTMETMVYVDNYLNLRTQPIQVLSYNSRWKLLTAEYYKSGTHTMWRIKEEEKSDKELESDSKEVMPLELIGVSPAFMTVIGYVPEKTALIGLVDAGSLALSRLPDGLVKCHFEDYCVVNRPKYWMTKNTICFVTRSSAFVPSFKLCLRFLDFD